jgi:hypothetical protein
VDGRLILKWVLREVEFEVVDCINLSLVRLSGGHLGPCVAVGFRTLLSVVNAYRRASPVHFIYHRFSHIHKVELMRRRTLFKWMWLRGSWQGTATWSGGCHYFTPPFLSFLGRRRSDKARKSRSDILK